MANDKQEGSMKRIKIFISDVMFYSGAWLMKKSLKVLGYEGEGESRMSQPGVLGVEVQHADEDSQGAAKND